MTLQKKIRDKFPFFKNNQGIYFDNAATTQKPNVVIERIINFYKTENSNVHRSLHKTGVHNTEEFEKSREAIKDFIGAESSDEIVFTSGTTDSINIIASSFFKKTLKHGDEILISPIEHHSNILPWQNLIKETGAKIKTIPIKADLTYDYGEIQKLLKRRSVKLLVIHHVSNVTGITQNIKQLIDEATKSAVRVVVDGAQAVAHEKINVKKLGCDFYCFSGHKMFGPTGTGVLFGKKELLSQISPYKFGGGMVKNVGINKSTWLQSPYKFEAGTQNIAGVLGLGKAVEFIQELGIDLIKKIETEIMTCMVEELKTIPGIQIYGDEKRTIPIFSFNIKNIHHYDLTALLAENNVLTRSGHLCNQPLMSYLNIDGCVRVSLAFYNTPEEINCFILTLKKVISFLKNNK